MHQDEDPAEKKRRQARERKARWLGKQKQESLKRIREANAASQRRHIHQLTPDQAIARTPYSRKCCISPTSHPAINSRSNGSVYIGPHTLHLKSCTRNERKIDKPKLFDKKRSVSTKME